MSGIEADVRAKLSAQSSSCKASCKIYTPPTDCLKCAVAVTNCISQCEALFNEANTEQATKFSDCEAAIEAEVAKGVSCEALAGKLTDLPGVLPIPRSAWTTCYAYSDECSARCQVKKGYLLMIPLGKRIIIMPHYGLDKDCKPTPPSLFGSFSQLPVNDMFLQYALYAGQSAFGGGFKGVNYVMQGVSIFSTVQAGLSEFKSCPIPTKPSFADRDIATTCLTTTSEVNTQKPGSKSGDEGLTDDPSGDGGGDMTGWCADAANANDCGITPPAGTGSAGSNNDWVASGDGT